MKKEVYHIKTYSNLKELWVAAQEFIGRQNKMVDGYIENRYYVMEITNRHSLTGKTDRGFRLKMIMPI